MKLPELPRWLAPVMVVVFLLLTVWAGYDAAHATAALPAQAPAPAGEYGAGASYLFTAALAPNDLYNTTNLTGTNLTLFASITHWINVTFTQSISLDVRGSIDLATVLTVTVSTPAWSKTLDRAAAENSSASATDVEVVDHYDLEVAAVEGVVHTIDAELNYTSPSFTVTLSAASSGSASAGGLATPILLSPWLNLSFAGALIVPSGVPAALAGPLAGGPAADDPPGMGPVYLAYAELTAAGTALAASVWLLWVSRRPGGASRLPRLERLVEPYEEAIARTTTVPDASRVVRVVAWDDLVKVADTLGRPILRPEPSVPVSSGQEFYVVDGAVAYVYQYPASGGAPVEPVRPARGTPPIAPAPVLVPGAADTGGASRGSAAKATAPRPTPTSALLISRIGLSGSNGS